MSRILAFFVLIALAGCAQVVTSGSVAGSWQLNSTLADPGDGSGRWTPVTNQGTELQLNSDGTVSGSSDVDYVAYKLTDEGKIEFTLRDNRKQLVSYSINGDTLIIRPQCIEACGFKYLRQ